VNREVHPLTELIRQILANSANPENAAPMQAYMKSEMPFRGVKAGDRKAIFSHVIKKVPVKSLDEYERIIRELWYANYREERYMAVTLARRFKKFQVIEMLPLYKMMIQTGAWWDYVDELAAHLVGSLLRKYPDEIKPILKQWIEDEDVWIRRSAILAQLQFKGETDAKLLFEFCESRLDESVFWITKAIGWALRAYSKTEPFAVRSFVDHHRDRMSRVTLKEAVKYI